MSDGDGPDVPSVAARDDLAGVVDLFGSLTRSELTRALSELAFKRRTDVDEEAIAAAIDVAVAEYAIVPAPETAVSAMGGADDTDDAGGASDDDPESGPTYLAVGPAAFPSLPDGAADLPHILDVPDREVDRDALASAVLDRLAEDAVSAITADDADRLAVLADVTYDVEAWAPVDTTPIRARIVAELDE